MGLPLSVRGPTAAVGLPGCGAAGCAWAANQSLTSAWG